MDVTNILMSALSDVTNIAFFQHHRLSCDRRTWASNKSLNHETLGSPLDFGVLQIHQSFPMTIPWSGIST